MYAHADAFMPIDEDSGLRMSYQLDPERPGLQ